MNTLRRIFRVVDLVPSEQLQKVLLSTSTERTLTIKVTELGSGSVKEVQCILNTIGGGHCRHPYRVSGRLFSPDEIHFRGEFTQEPQDSFYGLLETC